jgi:hypothetical protein
MSRRRWAVGYTIAALALTVTLLAGCGSSAASTASSNGPADTGQSGNTSTNGGQTSFGSAATRGTGQSNNAGPQYLIKALAVAMVFSDTRKVASDLQTWIATADPQSSSAGQDYEQVGSNSYRVTITFSVAASAYARVLLYLSDYAQTHHGNLESLHETVRDASNDYVDTQSRLKNLRTEQNRLLALLTQASTLSDTLTIEQRLTDVEGQIEQIEAHLNLLNGQTTFSKVTVTLDPLASPQPESPNAPWNPGQTVHDAFSAALGFGQGLVSLLIWLLFFAVYLIPVALVFLLVRRMLRVRAERRAVPLAPMAAAQSAPNPPSTPAQ